MTPALTVCKSGEVLQAWPVPVIILDIIATINSNSPSFLGVFGLFGPRRNLESLTLSCFVYPKKNLVYPKKKIFYRNQISPNEVKLGFFDAANSMAQKVLRENGLFCHFLAFLGHFLDFLVKNGPKPNNSNDGEIVVC